MQKCAETVSGSLISGPLRPPRALLTFVPTSEESPGLEHEWELGRRKGTGDMGFGHVDISDVGAVKTLGGKVGDCAADIEGLSYEPSLETATSGNQNSSIASACSGKDGQIEDAVKKLCDNLRQYDGLCQDAADTYDNTDDAAADRVNAAGGGRHQHVAQ